MIVFASTALILPSAAKPVRYFIFIGWRPRWA
jgi:hypothetical protein